MKMGGNRGHTTWILLLGLLAVLLRTADASEGPIVEPAAERSTYTLYRGDDLTLECRGRGGSDVNWTRQRVIEQSQEQGFTDRVTAERGAGRATLRLGSVDEHAVGYYACHDPAVAVSFDNLTEEPKDDAKVTYIYIYVNGTKSTFADHRASMVIREGSTFVVLCRPTLPEIEIELSDGSNPLPVFNNKMVTFNPKLGFVVWNSTILRDENFLICTINGNDGEQIFLPLLTISAKTETPAIHVPLTIYGTNETRALLGEELRLNCTVPRPESALTLLWYINGVQMDGETQRKGGRYSELSNMMNSPGSGGEYFRSFVLTDLEASDAGTYVCSAKYAGSDLPLNDTTHVTILEKPYLKLSAWHRRQDKLAGSHSPPNWKIDVENAYPVPEIINIWKLGDKLVEYKEKFKIEPHFSGTPKTFYFVFAIKNFTVNDSGDYMIVAKNRYTTNNLTITAEIQDGAKILESVSWKRVVKGTQIEIPCRVTGNPLPQVSWSFQPDCLDNTTHLADTPPSKDSPDSPYSLESIATINIKCSGILTCTATNELNKDKKRIKQVANHTFSLEVYELDGGFGITSISEDSDNVTPWLARDSEIWFECLASKYDFFNNVTWYRVKQGVEMETIAYEPSETSLSYVSGLHIPRAQLEHSGEYRCEAVRTNHTIAVAALNLTVEEWRKPVFLKKLDEQEMAVKENRDLNLNCSSDGVPRPDISWFHDGVLLHDSNESLSIQSWETGHTVRWSRLIVPDVQPQHVGRYECRASSGGVEAVTYVEVFLKSNTASAWIYLSAIAIMVAVFLFCISYLLWKIRKEKKYRKNLLRQFNDGNTNSLNPDLALDEQADLLPYDKKYEFPPNKLEILEILGAGAFGEVFKAEASGIVDAEVKTLVAVKKVRRDAEPLYRDALVKELKIMCHIGKHLNVLNLLGACTKKIARRELMVILEYCKFGNIHNYIQKHREVFIDQLCEHKLPADGGQFNEGFSSSTANTSHANYFGSDHTPVTGHTSVESASNTGELTAPMRSGSESDYITEPKWRSNYRSDCKEYGVLRPLCSRDLLCWSYQIACGMDYLASRKVLHGDLAARNILLAEDNVVKICDFGFARTIQKNDVYQKQSDDPVPVKWLALECLKSQTFSTQSDVWSYGVVLWELFSLAKKPYPDCTTAKDVYEKLNAGERLPRPRYADEQLYTVMLKCWNRKPAERPPFAFLADWLGQRLEDSVRNHYLQLNSPYEVSNDEKWRSTETQDYLAVVSAPNYRHQGSLSTPTPLPHYQNNCFFPQPATDAEGYLQMSPGTQLTRYSTQPAQFSFERGPPGELTPMLEASEPPPSPAPAPSPAADDVFDVSAVVRERALNFSNRAPPADAVDNPSYNILDIEDKKPAHNYLNIIPSNGIVK